MVIGQWRALFFLTVVSIFSFLAGKEAQRREMVPVDRVMVQDYLDSLLEEKRWRDSAWLEWCKPGNRIGFIEWRRMQDEQYSDSLTLTSIP